MISGTLLCVLCCWYGAEVARKGRQRSEAGAGRRPTCARSLLAALDPATDASRRNKMFRMVRVSALRAFVLRRGRRADRTRTSRPHPWSYVFAHRRERHRPMPEYCARGSTSNAGKFCNEVSRCPVLAPTALSRECRNTCARPYDRHTQLDRPFKESVEYCCRCAAGSADY